MNGNTGAAAQPVQPPTAQARPGAGPFTVDAGGGGFPYQGQPSNYYQNGPASDYAQLIALAHQQQQQLNQFFASLNNVNAAANASLPGFLAQQQAWQNALAGSQTGILGGMQPNFQFQQSQVPMFPANLNPQLLSTSNGIQNTYPQLQTQPSTTFTSSNGQPQQVSRQIQQPSVKTTDPRQLTQQPSATTKASSRPASVKHTPIPTPSPRKSPPPESMNTFQSERHAILKELDFEALSRDLEAFQKSAAAARTQVDPDVVNTVLAAPSASRAKPTEPVIADSDPFATKLWKFYAKAKSTLPQGERMENLSWRLGGMKLNSAKQTTVANVPTEKQESERRGRQARSTATTPGNTPESSGESQGQTGDLMDWRQASRSRSRVAHISEMEWRAQSTSRSRSRARPQSVILPTSQTPLLPVESRDTASATMASLGDLSAQYSSAVKKYGNRNSVSLDASNDTVAAFSSALLANAQMPAPASSTERATSRRRGSFDSSKAPGTSLAAHSYAGPIKEIDVTQNHHAEYGFLPKVVRKTSFDAAYAVTPITQTSGLPANSAQKVTPTRSPPKTPTRAVHFAPDNIGQRSIDLAALARPLPMASSLSHSRPADLAQINTSINPPYDHSLPTSASYLHGGMPYGNAYSHAFTSLPNSPMLNSYGNYFAFGQNSGASTPASYSQPVFLSQPSSFIDPALIQTGPQTMSNFSHQDDLAWLNSVVAAEPSPARTDVSTPPSDQLDRLAQSLTTFSPEMATNLNFAGGPMRSAPRKRAQAHQRSNSLAGATSDLTPFTPANSESPKENGATVCSNCSTTNTPLWRRDESGSPLCNGCGLFKKLHGIDRPLSLATGIIKKRNRSRVKDKKGATGKGTARKARSPDE